MTIPRGLSAEEQAAWARLAQSVTPLAGRKVPGVAAESEPKRHVSPKPSPKPVMKPAPKLGVAKRPAAATPPPPKRAFNSQLDGHWNRRIKSGDISPDYTLDLHGHTLDSAYTRIIAGLDQARAMGARVVLVVAGRERPVDPADRQHKRGAIRAKLLDWLAASHHAEAIAAVRRAHIRHGGDGALYLVLKRSR
ncbi:DNA mismatch repair protein MutS [Erythrobacter sp. JL475]|jgi:DNA-nicking Smr family endonuclease|uniref:Smr/MutS family protein n=1 Tax=Erythrobacter aurantius TaxID=2909249 RepID=UPI0004D82D7E|nr:Smr/MutS family protein [Erythrobacter aurantius]KEO86439.1 DNA mismatch repair protein MutS [Erythrobacter sp. JL475]